MRKTIATTALTLGLMFSAAPTIAATPDPNAPSTNGQCEGLGVTNQVCDYLLDWARLYASLNATATQQSATIAHQSATITKQRATIKRLRQRLAHARH